MDTLHEVASELDNTDFGDHDPRQPFAIDSQHKSDTVHELGNALHVTLQVKEGQYEPGSNLPVEDDGSSSMEDEGTSAGECDINFDGFMATSGNPLHKCATFHAEDFELENDSLRRTVSLPTAGKLISAMKGSREKEGLPLGKLSVSWAPDVYDPPPTSLSHNPKKKILTRQQIKSNKKHGKGKQKGKNARGGGNGPKEKKHYSKVGGRSDRCVNSYSDSDRVISHKGYKLSTELRDYDDDDGGDDDDDLHNPDSSWGSSYLGKSHGAMHFGYTEAT